MSRTTVLLVVAALVVAGVPATAAFAQETTDEEPGATFAGVVGVQGAEVEGEVQGRALGQQLASAETNESRAAVVASQTDSIRAQLVDLRERREDLRERYRAGNMSRGEYRAKLARVVAQTRTLEARLNTTAEAADGLPEETLRERGVNAAAIAELRSNASNLTDGEAAEAARGIAGKGTGQGLAGEPGPPANRGPPDDRGEGRDGTTENGTETDRGPPEDRGNPENSNADDAVNASVGGDDGARGNSGDASGGDAADTTNASEGDRGNSGAGSDGARGNSGSASGDGDDGARGNSGDASGGGDDGARGNSGNANGGGADGDRGNSGTTNGDADEDGADGTETESPRLGSARAPVPGA
ncbi:hypothetical protein [Halobaculum litoreum]|uniref:DUF5667 domain-containing protein n=1 Tax=Halobaculum litoreum TaxID=3031998 RepID=A0ABD5XPZ8_9EURY|nr:hypothetical protein [Halobaculum sp. DT92]